MSAKEQMNELMCQIESLIERSNECSRTMRILDTESTRDICRWVGERLGKGPGDCWWWENAPGVKLLDNYSEADGIAALRAALACQESEVTLVITDDDFPPWNAIRGDLDIICYCLEELPFFEYFLVDESRSWVLFDTHHNELLIHGDLSE